jgi:DNA-binding transcriptional regulator YdaS (Cro superfamily)
MKLNDWLGVERGRGLALANSIGVSPVLISQWSTGPRVPPIERCVPIERATNGAVTRQDLRPDDWQAIWPELAAAQSPPAPPAIEAIAPKGWDGVDRRQLTKQVINPADGRREIDRPDGFPVIAGV